MPNYGTVSLSSPNSTLGGDLLKKWKIVNGERVLLKSGVGFVNQEPYNEVIATELFSRLLSEDDYVPYTLIEWGGAPVSSCPNFVGPTEEFIPAYYVNEVLPSAPIATAIAIMWNAAPHSAWRASRRHSGR